MAGVTAAPPARAYVPGKTARHPDGRFDAIRAGALVPTASGTADRNAAFQAGLDFLETGFFWEAHEVLEPVWMNAPAGAPERALVQALIQLANAALKQRMDRPRAALRLCGIAAGLLDQAGSPADRVMGLEIAVIRQAVDSLACAVKADRLADLCVRRCPAN